jgi:hypothetical protein
MTYYKMKYKSHATMKSKSMFIVFIGAVLYSSFFARDVKAFPSLTPHRNVPGTIFWEEDGVEDGSTNHNHLFPHDIRKSTIENHVHDAFACWDNRTFRYKVGSPTIGGGFQNPFFHCFIEPGKEPRYKFIDGTDASIMFNDASKGIIADGVSKWVKAAQEQSKGKTTEDGSSLVTGIGLVPTTGKDFEIRIGFFDNLFESRSGSAEWLVADEQTVGITGLTAVDLDTSPILAFDDDINWLFSLDPTVVPDNTGTQRDFSTISLHELGHVFGLLHAPGDPAGNLMRASIRLEAGAGTDPNRIKTMRNVDINSANGAAELYTQPVPAPLPLFGLFAAVSQVRKLRRLSRTNQRSYHIK